MTRVVFQEALVLPVSPGSIWVASRMSEGKTNPVLHFQNKSPSSLNYSLASTACEFPPKQEYLCFFWQNEIMCEKLPAQ